MFAALSENPEYYRERMNGFVALSPIVFMSNIKSEFFKKIATDESIAQNIEKFETITPEIFPFSIAGNSFTKFMTKTDLLLLTNDLILSKLTDSDPSRIDQDGYHNL